MTLAEAQAWLFDLVRDDEAEERAPAPTVEAADVETDDGYWPAGCTCGPEGHLPVWRRKT